MKVDKKRFVICFTKTWFFCSMAGAPGLVNVSCLCSATRVIYQLSGMTSEAPLMVSGRRSERWTIATPWFPPFLSMVCLWHRIRIQSPTWLVITSVDYGTPSRQHIMIIDTSLIYWCVMTTPILLLSGASSLPYRNLKLLMLEVAEDRVGHGSLFRTRMYQPSYMQRRLESLRLTLTRKSVALSFIS